MNFYIFMSGVVVCIVNIGYYRPQGNSDEVYIVPSNVIITPPFLRYLVVLPGDVPARREADERHLRAAGVLHRNLLLRSLRSTPHKDEQVGFVRAL